MQPNTILANRYRILDLLGSGGMANVYRAREEQLNRDVAIKVIAQNLSFSHDYVSRFVREAQTIAALQHPHIIQLYSFDITDVGAYLAMPLLKGGTLAQRIEQIPFLPSVREIGEFTRQIADALQYAHDNNIVHRDIKLSNIMFDDVGTPIVMDFGIAKLIDNTRLTGTGTQIGTPQFMAPEQWRGQDVGPAVDQYALAILCFVLFTGNFPFEGDTVNLMYHHFESPIPDIQALRADIPPTIVASLQRALSKKAEDRFPSIAEFANSLYESSLQTPRINTGFFKTKLNQSLSVSRPISSSNPAPSSQAVSTKPRANNYTIFALASLSIIILLSLFLMYFIFNSNQLNSLTAELTLVAGTQSAFLNDNAAETTPMLEVPSEELAQGLTQTASTATPSPTHTSLPTHTSTATHTLTATRTATATHTLTATRTATASPTNNLNLPDAAQNSRSYFATARASVRDSVAASNISSEEAPQTVNSFVENLCLIVEITHNNISSYERLGGASGSRISLPRSQLPINLRSRSLDSQNQVWWQMENDYWVLASDIIILGGCQLVTEVPFPMQG